MCVIWGTPYLMIRVAVRELTPATLVFGRTALGALILLPIAVRRRELGALRAYWAPLLAFAAVEIAAPWLLLATAEKRVTSSLTGLLIAAVPLVGAAITSVSGDDDRLGKRRLGGLLIGLGGVAAIVGLDTHATSALALVEIAIVVVCYAAGPIILVRWLSDLPGLGVIAASLAVCTIAYAPVAAFQLPATLPAGRVLLSVVGLAVLCTAIAFLVFFELIAEVGPVRATVITYINPAVAALLGVTLLGESFTLGMGVGFVLVLAGSVVATRRNAARDSTPVLAAEP
jgi:drug/metabolite transporter (DMT)-like permease